jgi:hypothetical protein
MVSIFQRKTSEDIRFQTDKNCRSIDTGDIEDEIVARLVEQNKVKELTDSNGSNFGRFSSKILTASQEVKEKQLLLSNKIIRNTHQVQIDKKYIYS